MKDGQRERERERERKRECWPSKGSVEKTRRILQYIEKTNVRPVLHGRAYLYIIMMVMTGVMAAVKYRIYTTGNPMKTSSRFMVRDQILVSTRRDLFIGETFSEIYTHIYYICVVS